MESLSERYTVPAVDELINEISRYDAGLQRRAESRTWTATERAVDKKLDAMCRALERRAELQKEIRSGLRSPDGSLNVRV